MQERAEVDEYNKRVKKENKAHENDPNWKKKRTKAAPALVYEEIAGVYQQSGPPLTEAEKRDMLKEYAEGWQERNPKMALVGIYYHADEEGKTRICISTMYLLARDINEARSVRTVWSGPVMRWGTSPKVLNRVLKSNGRATNVMPYRGYARPTE